MPTLVKMFEKKDKKTIFAGEVVSHLPTGMYVVRYSGREIKARSTLSEKLNANEKVVIAKTGTIYYIVGRERVQSNPTIRIKIDG